MQRYTVDLDETVGTLYILAEEGGIDVSEGSEDDPWLILDFNKQGEVVGLVLCIASDVSLEDWKKYKTRDLLPAWLRQALDLWLTVGPKLPHEMAPMIGSRVAPLRAEKD